MGIISNTKLWIYKRNKNVFLEIDGMDMDIQSYSLAFYPLPGQNYLASILGFVVVTSENLKIIKKYPYCIFLKISNFNGKFQNIFLNLFTL